MIQLYYITEAFDPGSTCCRPGHTHTHTHARPGHTHTHTHTHRRGIELKTMFDYGLFFASMTRFCKKNPSDHNFQLLRFAVAIIECQRGL